MRQRELAQNIARIYSHLKSESQFSRREADRWEQMARHLLHQHTEPDPVTGGHMFPLLRKDDAGNDAVYAFPTRTRRKALDEAAT